LIWSRGQPLAHSFGQHSMVPTGSCGQDDEPRPVVLDEPSHVSG
jgi:hypothetical protein